MNSIGSLQNTRILLLQGPVGFFFKKLDTYFRKKGAKTYRIGFNMGDQLFSYMDNYIPYRGTQAEWPSYIKAFLKEHHIDKIFLFGDCRYYQSIAVQTAMALNIDVFVFEEGYIRPYYITLERYGVNNYSLISRKADFYRNLEPVDLPKPVNVSPNSVVNWAIVMLYYLSAKLFLFRYRHYKHHRNFSVVEEFFYGTRSLIRKIIYTKRDKKYLPIIQTELSKKYFFVPLQTYNDFQILQHSHYGSIEKFIIEVLESFAYHAESDVWLIFKHHPIDRGRKNYKKFILEQAEELGIDDRILVVHDLHLPTLLNHTKGTVTINSTVGLSSIEHHAPTIVLGNAFYDIPGLTNHNKSLNDFWKNPEFPEDLLYQKFRYYLIQTTQLNGNFYGKFPVEFQ